jgi:hypothetical protein
MGAPSTAILQGEHPITKKSHKGENGRFSWTRHCEFCADKRPNMTQVVEMVQEMLK